MATIKNIIIILAIIIISGLTYFIFSSGKTIEENMVANNSLPLNAVTANEREIADLPVE